MDSIPLSSIFFKNIKFSRENVTLLKITIIKLSKKHFKVKVFIFQISSLDNDLNYFRVIRIQMDQSNLKIFYELCSMT